MSTFAKDVKPTNFSALNVQNNPDSANDVGGQVIRCTAAAALDIGDAVYFDSAGKVNKSGTAATVGVAFAGIVVGGISYSNEWRVSFDTPVLASPVAACAADGDTVLVQISGIAWVRADSAIAAGARAIGGTTAGNIAAGTTAGSMLGTVVSTEAAAGTAVCKMFIDHR